MQTRHARSLSTCEVRAHSRLNGHLYLLNSHVCYPSQGLLLCQANVALAISVRFLSKPVAACVKLMPKGPPGRALLEKTSVLGV